MSGAVSGPGASEADETRARRQSRLSKLVATGGIWVLALNLVLIVLFTVLSPNNVFWSQASLLLQLRGLTLGLLLALGIAMLLGAGIIDISIGANLVFSSVIGAAVVRQITLGGPVSGCAAPDYQNVALAIVLGLVACVLTGALVGLVNGVLMTFFRINSLIATLGMASVLSGLALVLTGGSDIGCLPPVIQDNFGRATIGGWLPVPAAIALIAATILWAVVRYTEFGMNTLAIGSSRVAALRAGIRVEQHLVKLTILTGALAGLAGFIDMTRYASTALNGHPQDALAAITAAVIGGTSLAGGKISIIGAVWGSALAMIVLGGLVMIGFSSAAQFVVIGLILLLVVGLDQWRTRHDEVAP